MDSKILIAIALAIVVVIVALIFILRAHKKARPQAQPQHEPQAQPQAQQQQPQPQPALAPPAPAPLPPAVAQPVEKPRAAPAPIVRAAERAELRSGLAKTRGGFISRLGKLVIGKAKIDEQTLAELEEVLFTADIGVKTSQRLIEALRGDLSSSQIKDADSMWSFIKQESSRLLAIGAPPLDFARAKPFVMLTIGVNGVGKTTTIGKLAAQLVAQGKKVLLAAGDTFRAAATEQLEVWGTRTGCPVIKGKEGGDPSSVVFDAVRRGALDGFDVVICDTAGRLHTKTNLMEELQKVRRVCDKASPGAPHETFLVLDATNGQNAIQQALLFKQAMDVTGIILTKLDGTAKGGVILGICNELRLPVRYIGIGERVEDLRPFDPEEFVEALYERSDAEQAA